MDTLPITLKTQHEAVLLEAVRGLFAKAGASSMDPVKVRPYQQQLWTGLGGAERPLSR